MSRLKNYASALGSSYVALGANIVYSLVSVPLALSYLDNAFFALWGLSIQIAGYIALIDLGMTGTSRILIDYKDSKDDEAYGSVLQTSILVSVAQAALIAVVGTVAAFMLVPLLKVQTEMQRPFIVMVIGQCALMAAAFITRVFTYLLAAHQRQDVLNYSQVILFAANFAVLWLGFEAGLGVFSLLVAQFCSWILVGAITIYWCRRLSVFPSAGKWGRASWARFRELFAFGRDIFLFALGHQLIHASQVILVTRQLGLEAAAVWLICTRSFTLASQLVYRVFDSSCPALAEMIVRNEKEWLRHRFRSIVVLSCSVAVLAGVICAAANQPFVRVWTEGKAGWPVNHDVLFAVWLIITAFARCHVGLVGQTKAFRFLRYIYLVEGSWFIVISLLFLKTHGIPAMLLAAISGTLLFSFPYGAWRTARYFQISMREVLWVWSWPAVRFGLILLVIGWGTWWLVQPLNAWLKFGVTALILLISGGPLLVYLGVNTALRRELQARWQALRHS